MFTPPRAVQSPKVERLSNRDWVQGTVSAFDAGRTPINGLESSSNVLIDIDGTVRPRPSLRPYGPQPEGEILGEIFEYKYQSGLDATQWMISLQKMPRNEVQRIFVTGSPTGGTFTLTYDGQTTTSIAYNASASTVQSALIALSNIGSGDVVCTAGPLPGTHVSITFLNALANTNVPLITATGSFTGGSSPAITVTQITPGGDVAYGYIARGEDADWVQCTGSTYDPESPAHFFQIQDKVVIANGVDSLSYFDITTSTGTPTITQYSQVIAPAAPTLDTLTGLTGTAFNVYYAITANSTVGETEGSAILTQPVSTDRDLWNPDTQSVKIEWTTVSGVKSWNVYMGISADGAGVPKMYLIAAGLDATILSFTDNGTRAQDLTRPMPTTNSTAGPKASRGFEINGRAWLVGDSDNPYYVWRGGDFGYELDFSPSNGGGFSPIGSGSKEVPIAVRPFRSAQGDPRVTVLSKGTNGYGKRFTLSPTTITYGGSSFVIWEVKEESGRDGTDSPDGVIYDGTSIYYPSRDGFKTTGTKPQLQNVLSTDTISGTIQKDISRLNTLSMPFCVGLAYEGRLYWSLPVGTNTNSEIWVLDLNQKGAWMKPWSVAADWLWLYNDNSGITHFCVLKDNAIYEFTDNLLTNDDGATFLTGGNSGRLYFSDDEREWGKIINVIFTFLNPQGNISCSVTCMTEDGPVVYTANATYGVTSTVVGWGEPSLKGIVGWGRHAWSQVEAIPEASGVSSADMIIEIDEEAQWWRYGWVTSGVGVDYALSNVVAEYVNVGIKDLS